MQVHHRWPTCIFLGFLVCKAHGFLSVYSGQVTYDRLTMKCHILVNLVLFCRKKQHTNRYNAHQNNSADKTANAKMSCT